jgi:hypothetical protein
MGMVRVATAGCTFGTMTLVNAEMDTSAVLVDRTFCLLLQTCFGLVRIREVSNSHTGILI